MTILACIVIAVTPLLTLLPAQAAEDSSDSVGMDFSAYDGLLIDSIEIDNRNIFDTDLPRYNNFAFIQS